MTQSGGKFLFVFLIQDTISFGFSFLECQRIPIVLLLNNLNAISLTFWMLANLDGAAKVFQNDPTNSGQQKALCDNSAYMFQSLMAVYQTGLDTLSPSVPTVTCLHFMMLCASF